MLRESWMKYYFLSYGKGAVDEMLVIILLCMLVSVCCLQLEKSIIRMGDTGLPKADCIFARLSSLLIGCLLGWLVMSKWQRVVGHGMVCVCELR